MEMMKKYHPHKRGVEISLELTLCYGHEACIINKKPRTLDAVAIRREKWYKEVEECDGISLRLTLAPPYDNPWKIRKTLTKSDVGKLSRLLMRSELVEAHILRFWDAAKIGEAKTSKGTQVEIYDHNTHSRHQLTFKLWSSSNSYVLNNNWNKEFVMRRVLRNGDEIGLFWNPHNSYICFGVITRA